MNNLTGTTGSQVVASGGTGIYTATGFDTSSVGIGKTLGVGLSAGDSASILGANPLSALSTNFTYNVYNHATSSLTTGTLELGNIHAGYTAPVTSTNSLTATNGSANDDRVDLQGSAPVVGNVALNGVNGIASGGSGSISATLATGLGLGTIDTPITYTFADQSSIAGASSNVGTALINVTGQVYSGQSVWAGTGATGSWGSLDLGFGTNWGLNQGSPGLDPGFLSSDSATFLDVAGQSAVTVNLNDANPSLNSITFNAPNTSFNLAPGDPGIFKLNNAGNGASINDQGGNQTISAPIELDDNASANVTRSEDTLNLSGDISEQGGSRSLTVNGPGTTILGGANTYSGGTTVASGTLYVDNATGSGTGSNGVTVNGGGVLGGNGAIAPTIHTAGTGVTLNSGAKLISGSVQSGPAVTPPGLTLDNSAGLNSILSVNSANLTFYLGVGGSTTPYSFGHPNGSSSYLNVLGDTAHEINFSGADSVTLVDLTNGALDPLGLDTPYLLVSAGSDSDYYGLVTTIDGTTLNLDGNGYVLGVWAGSGNPLTDYTPISLAVQNLSGGSLESVYPAAYNKLYLEDGKLEIIPEPSTWALMIGGLAALIFYQRRRQS